MRVLDITTHPGTQTRSNEARLNVDQAVRDRYSAAARQLEAELCCPVDYNQRYLDAIPAEVLERDYGCGDPSPYAQPGETVLDLGSGSGKVCFIAAQIVGPAGRVIGVDCNDDMLALARKYQPLVAQRLEYANVEFRKGNIQDLALDLELLDRYLGEHPAASSNDWLRAAEHARELRRTQPLVADDCVDLVVSNCVLNLVRPEDRGRLFAELFRVLKPGGRAVISDIVCDEDVPPHLQADPQLWSGCLSGAFREDRLLEAFEQAGFYGLEILSRQAEPWAVVEGIEFRSMTVRAFKGKPGPGLDRRQAVVYNGPWKSVADDEGRTLLRGLPVAVCENAYHLYTRPPYADQITAIPPHTPVPRGEAEPMTRQQVALRSARETKGDDRRHVTQLPEGDCCGPGGCC